METALDFFSLLYRIVRGWPAVQDASGRDMPCKRLQTFAVLKDPSQLNSGTLDKDTRYAGKELFFSRTWNDHNWKADKIGFQYPGLFIILDDQDLQPNEGCFHNTMSFRMFVLCEAPRKDQQQLYPDGDACKSRTYEEVEEDANRLLREVLGMLLDTIKAEVTFPSTATQTIWAPQASLNQAQTDGKITGFVEMDRLENLMVTEEGKFPVITIPSPFKLDAVMGAFCTYGIITISPFSKTTDVFASESQVKISG